MRSTKTPKGLQAPSPGQASEATRHPGLGRRGSDTPPEGAKATTERIHYATSGHKPRQSRQQPPTNIPSVAAFAPSGGASLAARDNPGCRVASLACPGLGSRCPFGAHGEPMTTARTPPRPHGEPMTTARIPPHPHGERMTTARIPPRPHGERMTTARTPPRPHGERMTLKRLPF